MHRVLILIALTCLLLQPVGAIGLTGDATILEEGRSMAPGTGQAAPPSMHSGALVPGPGDRQVEPAPPGGAPQPDAWPRPDPQRIESPKPLPFHAAAPTGDLAELIAQVESDTGYDATHPLAPPGLRGLRMLAQPNGTGNATDNGTISHRHQGVGGTNLDAVWETAFHGVPYILRSFDLDADGEDEVLAGTELGIVAIDEQGIRWSFQLGSDITALFPVDIDGDGQHEVGISTGWGFMSPRVAVLDGDGSIVYEHVTQSPVVNAGPAGDGSGDVLAIEAGGRHFRIGADGEEVWSTQVDITDDMTVGLGIASVYHWVFGHYLGAVGDLNGDGVADAVSAAMQYNRGYAFVPFVWTGAAAYTSMLYATDGVTGDRLWLGPAASPPGTSFAYHVLFDIDLLDANGDGALDVAFTEWGYAASYAFPAPPVWTYSTGFRVLDGASDRVATSWGGRQIVTPQVQAARYYVLEHTDIQGDGMDELVVAHSGVLADAVHGETTVVERYAMAPSAAAESTMVLVGDSPVAVSGMFAFHGLEREDGRHIGISTADLADGGFIEIAPDGTVGETVSFPGTLVLAAATWQGSTLYASLEGVWLPGDEMRLVPFYGSPLTVANADVDGDGTPDLVVLGSDANVHVRDGLTGQPLRSIDLDMPIIDMAVLRAAPMRLLVETIQGSPGDYRTGLQVLRANGTVEWEQLDAAVVWASGGPVLFDGDEDDVLDFLTAMQRSYDEGWALQITAAAGADGRELWSQRVTTGEDFPFYVDNALVASVDGGDDLVFVDGWNGIFAVDGATGKTLFWDAFEQSWYDTCLGAYDPDRDGKDSVVLVRGRFDDAEAMAYTGGNVTSVRGLAPDSLTSCGLLAVPVPGGERLAIAWTDRGAGRDAHLALFADGEGQVWKQKRATISDMYAPIQLLGTDRLPQSRILVAREDHILVYAAEDGKVLGEFTFDGPWVRGGAFVDLDEQRQLEIAATTVGGMVYVLSDDAEGVGKTLAQKAQAKNDDKAVGQKSPVGLLAVVALGAALLLRRR